MKARVIGLALFVLSALTIVQFVALRQMRLEIGRLRAELAGPAIEARKDEIVRSGLWLHDYLQTPPGSNRAGGLCPGGSPDLETFHWFVATYLRARATGRSEAEAREGILTALHAPPPRSTP